jgi:hypothetical protein
VLTMDTKFRNQVFYVWLVDLQTICIKYELETWIVYVCSTCSAVEQKTGCEPWITRKVVNSVNLFHFSYLISLPAYLSSQWAPNVQIKYFMFDWSVYRLLMINRGWKRDSHQMMIFVYVCSACRVGERKTRFDTWNEVNCVYTSQVS